MSINYQELVPQKALGKEISHHIFQTYRSKTGLPHEIEQNIEYLKRSNPEYEYHLFDDEDIKAFILEHYGEVIWGYYQRIAPAYGAARADFFRYLLVYECGGVYIDIKSSLDRPLKEVLRPEDKFILTHWDNLPGGQYEGIPPPRRIHPVVHRFRGWPSLPQSRHPADAPQYRRIYSLQARSWAVGRPTYHGARHVHQDHRGHALYAHRR